MGLQVTPEVAAHLAEAKVSCRPYDLNAARIDATEALKAAGGGKVRSLTSCRTLKRWRAERVAKVFSMRTIDGIVTKTSLFAGILYFKGRIIDLEKEPTWVARG